MSAKRHGSKGKTAPKPTPKPLPRERQVTAAMLVDHLNSITDDRKCSFCGIGDYAVPADPNGTTASLVAAPIPYMSTIGLWLYTAVCTHCSNVVFFHAPFTAARIIKD